MPPTDDELGGGAPAAAGAGQAPLRAAGAPAGVPGGSPCPLAVQAEADDGVGLWGYVKVLVRRRWVVVWSVLGCMLVAAAYAWRQPVVYEATALVLPVGQVDYLRRSEGLDLETASAKPYVAVLRGVPVRRSVAQRSYAVEVDGALQQRTLVEYLQGEAPAGVSPDEWQRRAELGAMAWLDGAVAISEGRGTGVLTISCRAPQPQLAAAIANEYVAQLVAYERRSSASRTQENLSLAAARLDSLEQQLRAAEGRLEQFRLRNQLLLADEAAVQLKYPDISMQHQRLTAEVSLKQSLYTTVANQVEVLRLQVPQEATGFEVLASAEAPVSGQRGLGRPVVAGGVVGFLVGLGLAFGWEYVAAQAAAGELEELRRAWAEDWARLRGRRRPRPSASRGAP